jgi:hypothetical protein
MNIMKSRAKPPARIHSAPGNVTLALQESVPPRAGNATSRKLRVIEFGGVTVTVPAPTTAERKLRLSETQAVVGQLKKVFAKPGVKLKIARTTPRYSADPKDMSLVLRRVGSEVTRGHFRNGVFEEA